MTKQLYLDNTYLFEVEAIIASSGHDDKGSYVILDQTIFYPQGGGQPSDYGTITGKEFVLTISFVKQIGNEIRHYINDVLPESYYSQKIICKIDKNRRLLNARYHTAAHLLGNIGEILYPNIKAVKGHSFPNEAYVEFQGKDQPELLRLQEVINNAISNNYHTKIFEIDLKSFEAQYYKLLYQIPENKKFRVMQIEDFSPVPCGGTHLALISEIGHMTICKIKEKNDIIRISYEIK